MVLPLNRNSLNQQLIYFLQDIPLFLTKLRARYWGWKCAVAFAAFFLGVRLALTLCLHGPDQKTRGGRSSRKRKQRGQGRLSPEEGAISTSSLDPPTSGSRRRPTGSKHDAPKPIAVPSSPRLGPSWKTAEAKTDSDSEDLQAEEARQNLFLSSLKGKREVLRPKPLSEHRGPAPLGSDTNKNAGLLTGDTSEPNGTGTQKRKKKKKKSENQSGSAAKRAPQHPPPLEEGWHLVTGNKKPKLHII